MAINDPRYIEKMQWMQREMEKRMYQDRYYGIDECAKEPEPAPKPKKPSFLNTKLLLTKGL